MHHPSCCVVSFSQGLREVGEKKRKMCAKRPAAETRATKPNPNFRVCGRATKETKETTSNQTPTFHADRITHACVRSKTNKGTATKVQQQQQQQQQKKKKKKSSVFGACEKCVVPSQLSAFFSPHSYKRLLFSPSSLASSLSDNHKDNAGHIPRAPQQWMPLLPHHILRPCHHLQYVQTKEGDALSQAAKKARCEMNMRNSTGDCMLLLMFFFFFFFGGGGMVCWLFSSSSFSSFSSSSSSSSFVKTQL